MAKSLPSSNANFDSLLLDGPSLHRRLCVLSEKTHSPAEQDMGLPLGLGTHFVGIIMFISAVCVLRANSILDAYTLSATFFASAAITTLLMLFLETRYPAAPGLPPLKFKDVAKGLVQSLFVGVIVGTFTVFAVHHALQRFAPWDGVFSWWSIAYAALLDDFIYYLYHRWFSHGVASNALAQFGRNVHRPHHSVAELDFLRGNLSSVLDTAVLGFQWQLPFVGRLYNMDWASIACTYGIVLLLQATHHVNHTVNIGKLRFVFVDNHAHKCHHLPWGRYVNLGACFAMWDRNLGTFYEDWLLNANYCHLKRLQLNVRPLPVGVKKRDVFTLAFIVSAFALPLVKGVGGFGGATAITTLIASGCAKASAVLATKRV